jgi:hypothetical protein
VRNSHGAGRLRSSRGAWCTSGSPTTPRIRSSLSVEETRPSPCRACLQASGSARLAPQAAIPPTSVGYCTATRARFIEPGKQKSSFRDPGFPLVAQERVADGATTGRRTNCRPMRSPSSDFRATPPPRCDDTAARRDAGDPRGEDVSPVLSDATGVRQIWRRAGPSGHHSALPSLPHPLTERGQPGLNDPGATNEGISC